MVGRRRDHGHLLPAKTLAMGFTEPDFLVPDA
jgi:hypothetical protein